MNPIAQGLALGYTGQQLLSFITNMIPAIGPKINSARKQGHSIESILNFVGKTMEAETFPKNMTQNQIHGYNAKKQENVTKGILTKAGMLAGGGIAAAALKRALPQSLQGLNLLGTGVNAPTQSTPQPPQGMQGIQNQPPTPQVQTPQQPPQGVLQNQQTFPSQNPPINNELSSTITQSSQIPQSQGNALQTPSAPPLPQPLIKQAESLLQAGNDIEKVAGSLKTLQPQIVKDYEKATGQPIARAVEEFAKSVPQKEKPQANIGSNLAGKESTPQISMEEKPIEAKKTVALPNGDIGEVTDIRQGIATVNSMGKEYRRKLDELVESPIPEKDLTDLFEDLTKEIEKKSGEEISRMVNWAGYDPKTNELAFVPHIGALYVYDDISPEDAAELTSILSTRKTSGENFLGAWKEGSKSPIGAAMSRLIQKLQKERGGKGSEYKGKYEKIYDAFELPKLEAKKKHKEKADEKRKAKKPRAS